MFFRFNFQKLTLLNLLYFFRLIRLNITVLALNFVPLKHKIKSEKKTAAKSKFTKVTKGNLEEGYKKEQFSVPYCNMFLNVTLKWLRKGTNSLM